MPLEIREQLSQILLEHIVQKSSLFYLIFTKDGEIVESNEYTKKLLGNVLFSKKIQDVFLNLSGSFDIERIVQNTSYTHILSVNSEKMIPQTFYFTFYPIHDYRIAFGELNYEEIEELRKNLFSSNNELANLARELHKKNAELGRLNELKNEFLGMAAHDLRNPISTISGFTALLLEDAGKVLPDEYLMFLHTIQSLSQFMLDLLNDLLDITAIESGKLKLNLTKANIFDIIQKQIDFIRVVAEKKQIELFLVMCEDIPEIMMDSFKVEQVLSNLLSNAIKYSHYHTNIHIFLSRKNEHIIVEVKDQGQGIPEEELCKLFKPFQRISVKATGGEKSTGLGLTIVQRIIHAHNGKVWVKSEVGKGSSFFFSLPILQNSFIPVQHASHTKISSHF